MSRLDGLHPLLAYLSENTPSAPGTWQTWDITPITGGANNLLYHVVGPVGDLAVKFTLRDARDRAGREYAALLVLQQAGLQIAPAPLLLDREHYQHLVVVQEWLSGQPLSRPPENDTEWELLITHFAAIHSVRPNTSRASLPRAVLSATTAEEAHLLVQQQLALLPLEARSEALQQLLQRLNAWILPSWPAPHIALARSDPNFRNIMRQPGAWASVDWENSGWSDPAFEIADLITHPAFIDIPEERWAWVRATYQHLASDTQIGRRIKIYTAILLVWWVVRLERYLYDIPRGQDRRLVPPQPGWEADIEYKRQHYTIAADAALQRAVVG